MATVKSLDERMDDFEQEFGVLKSKVDSLAQLFEGFKGRIETTLALLRWIGVFSAGFLLTMILGVVSFSHSVGKLEATVEQLQEISRRQEKTLDEQNKVLTQMGKDISEIRAKIKL